MWVRCVCFSPDGNHLATGSEDHLIRIWEIESGDQKVLSGHQDHIYSLCYVPDGETLVSGGGSDRKVMFWNTQTGSAIFSLDLPNSVKSVSTSPDCEYVAIGCLDNNCYLFYIETKSLFTVLRDHQYFCYSVEFSPDREHIATASIDRTIKIWRLGHSPQLVRTLEGHEVWRKGCRLGGLR
ncbi:hypothetical protein IL306_010727 [Fusarium sp. DS 682]|nr:hypothetical protein IL306_010727 [Fusarium sp. DS 682]